MLNWNDIKNFDITDIDITKIDLTRFDIRNVDLPKLDLPKIDLPKLDLPKADLPKLDLPNVDLPKLDLPAGIDRASDLARDAAYVGVGAMVVTAQKVDERRRELTDQVTSQVRKLVDAVA